MTMVTRPRKPFSLSARPESEQEKIRDKDNAEPPFKPDWADKPRWNLAPPGMAGIRRGLPSAQPRNPEKQPVKSGDLTRCFGSKVGHNKSKDDRDIDR